MRRSSRPHDGNGRRREHSAASDPKANLLLVLDRAEDLEKEHEIDTILSQIPPPVSFGEGGTAAGTHIDLLPPGESSKPLGMVMGPMSADEEARLIADVYGRKPPGAALMEERLDALEREIGRLDREERSSLDKALRHHPLLTIVSPHVRAVIREDDYDAPSAARRLARYWRQREEVFGSRAFSSGIFTQPEFDDYNRYYYRCMRAMDDPELDDEMRNMARGYVRIVNRVKIKAMDKLIEESPEKDRGVLMEARKLNPEMAQSDEHKLLFLKCEDFVEARAAVRMMKYWAMKKALFGPDHLGKVITLADVESSVFESNVVGHFLLVPGTDEAGRTVFWINLNELNGEGWTTEGMTQYMWCVLHMALDRPSCRDNGIVFMFNVHGMNAATVGRRSTVRRFGALLMTECLPFRFCVAHAFLPSSSWWQSTILALIKKISTVVYKRFVLHIGTFEENRKVLEENFGIGPDQVIKELGGNVDMDWWRGWIREKKEEGH